MTGTQALLRILLDQARRDRRVGLNTAGLVSGYRGSPLGALDLEMWNARALLDEHRIEFMPAINEDLGATAVLGAQRAALEPGADVEGVFSMWYGKGPGVDRSGDALKHGNAYGSAPKGGVLVVAGDDHGCVSSSMPHQSDVAFQSWFMPVLNPASVGEYLTFGEFGIALSRFSGTWVGFKAISETVESGQSLELLPDRNFTIPDFTPPPGGLHMRLSDPPGAGIEIRIAHKLRAVQAFVEANPIDRKIYDTRGARFGIVTSGKAHLDLMEALRLLGLGAEECRRIGIDIYKVGMVWPLARRDALDFVRGKTEVLVVEEKRGIIEGQLKEYFYDWPGDKPHQMVGKTDSDLDPLVPWTSELSPLKLVPIVAARLDHVFDDLNLTARARKLTANPPKLIEIAGAARVPYFCSGCPHSTSTRVPEGSRAGTGIGCHVMASWMDRNTSEFTQMGGEGVAWAAASKFNQNRHRFQNLGEGTWFHSGILAIRQAIALNANITYKILYNDAVAMTGGQPVDGPISVEKIAASCRAEGISRIALVSDDISKFKKSDFPRGTSFDGRENLDQVQRELREIKGVTALIYQQTCATEKRRRRKRGTLPDPARFAVINDLVCEACGDCSRQSNCLSVEPKETPLGRKRRINLSSCNKDFTCLNGFCPSFITIEGGKRRQKSGQAGNIDALLADLPLPAPALLDEPFDLLVAGVGGTGVVTIGAIITMAAHVAGLGASVLDFTGFSQKFGTVLSYIRIARRPDAINQARIDLGSADAVIACDIVSASSPKASECYSPETRMVLNLAEMPTGDLVLSRDASLRVDARQAAIADLIGSQRLKAFDANQMAETLLGDAVFANMLMLGHGWQSGLVPIELAAIDRAIELNGVAVEKNRLAFAIGRILSAKPDAFGDTAQPQTTGAETPESVITYRANYLSEYQNTAYAERYRQRLAAFQDALPADISRDEAETLGILAAKSLFKLMAVKDEYEVARLHISKTFRQQLEQDFEGDFTVRYHLAPPFLPLGKDATGRPRKVQFGNWLTPVLAVLARLKPLRGTGFDPFSYRAERRQERALVGWYETCLDAVATRPNLPPETRARLLAAAMDIRGFGPVKQAAIASVQKEINDLIAQPAN